MLSTACAPNLTSITFQGCTIPNNIGYLLRESHLNDHLTNLCFIKCCFSDTNTIREILEFATELALLTSITSFWFTSCSLDTEQSMCLVRCLREERISRDDVQIHCRTHRRRRFDNNLRVSFNSADFKEAGLHKAHMLRSSRATYVKEGSKVGLGRLKNPDLNGKTGTIIGYTKGGDRVIISVDGPHGLVKVKPKNIEILEGLPADAHDRTSAHPGLSRAKSQQSQQLAQSYQTDASAASLSSM